MSVTGEPDGEPMKAGVAMTDILTGMYAATAVLAALAHRELTGVGQRVDLALPRPPGGDAREPGRELSRHRPRAGPLGNAHASIVPYQAFATRDGYLVVAVGNDAQFARLCEVTGRPVLAADPRFATNTARVENRAALVPVLEALLAGRPTREWVRTLEEAGVPCGPINDLAQVFDDPHVRARGLRVEVPHPLAGRVPVVASPMRLSGRRSTTARRRSSASTRVRCCATCSAWGRRRSGPCGGRSHLSESTSRLGGPRRLRGVLTPVLTPFHADLSPDARRLARFCRWLLAHGCAALAPRPTSEANSLSVDEREILLDAILEDGVPADRLLPGTGACSLTDAVRLTAQAVRRGCAPESSCSRPSITRPWGTTGSSASSPR